MPEIIATLEKQIKENSDSHFKQVQDFQADTDQMRLKIQSMQGQIANLTTCNQLILKEKQESEQKMLN